MNRWLIIGFGILAALLWLVPPVGILLAMAAFAVVPFWGRSLTQRFLITGIIGLGFTTLVFARWSVVPINSVSSRIALLVFIALLIVLRWWRGDRAHQLWLRPTWSDAATGGVGIAGGWLLGSAYWGQPVERVLSGLFLSGWDNQAHFTTFANDYAEGMTLWATADGSTAWNQWYPSLHTTVWALGEYAGGFSSLTARTDLIVPFTWWSIVTFAVSVAALSWISGFLVTRLGTSLRVVEWAAPLAVVSTGSALLFGSTMWLFNFGFTNYLFAIAVLLTTSVLAAHSSQAARRIGWFLVPLGALALANLWTPLILGLIPAGFVVVIVLWRSRTWLAMAGIIIGSLVVGVNVLSQSRAIVSADVMDPNLDFATTLGRIVGGYIPFNAQVGLATVAVSVAAVVVWAVYRRSITTPLAALGPIFALAPFTWYAASLARNEGIDPLLAYYTLKLINGLFLMALPLLFAVVTLALMIALIAVFRTSRISIVGVFTGLVLGFFVWQFHNWEGNPADKAMQNREQAVADVLAGEVILRSVEQVKDINDRTVVMWDSGDRLQNLWLRALTGVLSVQEYELYSDLGVAPYEQEAALSLAAYLDEDPTRRVAVTWFREPGRVTLTELQRPRGEFFVELVRVPMRQSTVCPECEDDSSPSL